MQTLVVLNLILALLFTLCGCRQALYTLVRLFRPARPRPAAQRWCRYAVLIAARNEEAVIGQLLDSLHAQDYPARLVDTFVVADNCTDRTAQVAAAHGAAVFVRQNREHIGKGWALSYLLERLGARIREYDGFLIFDADNLLEPNYLSEMNRVFSQGAPAVVGCRAAKNFGENWLTAGYGLYFLEDSAYRNRPRDRLGIGCAVSGTGFLLSAELLADGWPWHTLSEDTQLTVELALRGLRPVYCESAVLYDEQPADFGQSLRQRARWIRGYLQVLSLRGKDLLRGLLRPGALTCLDLLLGVLSGGILPAAALVLNLVGVLFCALADPTSLGNVLLQAGAGLAAAWLMMAGGGALVACTERRFLPRSPLRAMAGVALYPLFLFSFLPAMVLAVLCPAQWVPIRHTAALSLTQLERRG